MMKIFSFVALLLALAAAADTGFVNKRLQRETNMQGRYVQISTEVAFAGEGTPRDKYYYAINATHFDKLAHFEVKSTLGRLEARALKENEVPEFARNSGYAALEINLKGKEGVREFNVYELYKRRLRPLPAAIGLKDDQLLAFDDTLYIPSLYFTEYQKTVCKIPANSIESYTKKDATTSTNSVTYGPFRDVKPFVNERMQVHFRSNLPLLMFSKVERTIQISHWGTIAVEEYYVLHNEGAAIKGEYSRVDYNDYLPDSGKSALKTLEILMHRNARNLFYYDQIGNISTSNAWKDSQGLHLRIKPRFPLFGGWKTDWWQGYDLATKFALSNDATSGNKFEFDFSFCFPYNSIIADHYKLKIVLPEGAKNHHTTLPFPIDKESEESYFGYLDMFGRPTLVFEKNNTLHELHDKKFQVTYEFTSTDLLLEPLVLVGFFAVLYLAAILYFRLDLNIKSNKKIRTD